MDLHSYLCNYAYNITSHNIENQSMENYDKFKGFIDQHYKLDYMKEHNYIKYVKVMRQKIVLLDGNSFHFLLELIEKCIHKMSSYHIFFKINIIKYLFNLDKIKRLLLLKEKNLRDTHINFKKLYDKFENKRVKFQILQRINNNHYKIILFSKYQRELLHLLHTFSEYEKNYGIDQKLIQIVNMERKLIGKKSEYKANELIKKFIKQSNVSYIYRENVDIFKYLYVQHKNKKYKGEIDGIIFTKEGNQWVIEYIIEVKSSIKATFEDVQKMIGLQKVISSYDFSENMIINDIQLNRKSFQKIIHKPLHEWMIYICHDENKTIDKSHLYFAYVTKIIDKEFIKNYYIDKKEDILRKKHQLILKNKKKIDTLFQTWKKSVCLTHNGSFVFTL